MVYKGSQEFLKGCRGIRQNSNEEKNNRGYSAGKMKRSFPECQLPADAANCFDVTIRVSRFLCLGNKGVGDGIHTCHPDHSCRIEP